MATMLGFGVTVTQISLSLLACADIVQLLAEGNRGQNEGPGGAPPSYDTFSGRTLCGGAHDRS